ncbi:MAG: hypothetical protein FWC26_06465 [Fibromonadales bacterium]|nr:hypothetical protein [Fibromonadales bacterium]
MIKARILILAIMFVSTVYAAKILGVLEITPATDDLDVKSVEMQHLTNELRRQAVLILSGKDFSVLTRDNLISLIPEDEEELECLENSCAVDIGRAIGVEYISQGSIGSFGGELSLSIELYETMSGKLLSSVVMESQDIKGLLAAIRAQAPSLFGVMLPPESVSPPLQVEKPIEVAELPPMPEVSKKSKTPFYVALGLDILGAAVLGIGVYNNAYMNNLYKDYKNMPFNLNEEEYKNEYKKVEAAKTDRNILYVVGSTLLLTGIAFHIYF